MSSQLLGTGAYETNSCWCGLLGINVEKHTQTITVSKRKMPLVEACLIPEIPLRHLIINLNVPCLCMGLTEIEFVRPSLQCGHRGMGDIT